MDNTREKLIELIRKPIAIMPGRIGTPHIAFTMPYAEELADHLIANSVTVQGWIPVTERFPDAQEYDWVLAQITFIPDCMFGVPIVGELRNGVWYDQFDQKIESHGSVKVTHWMPLPQPPKGE